MIVTDRTILEQVSKPTSINECRSIGIFSVLEAVLEESKTPGAGLAAIQIGKPMRAVYIKYKDMQLKMINPIIEEMIDPIVYSGEGCLSCPNENYNTDRFNQCTVRWYDCDQDKEIRAVFTGFESVLMQHECNHLDGILLYKMEHKSLKIGRNELCPMCLKIGTSIKWKKCNKHNIEAMK